MVLVGTLTAPLVYGALFEAKVEVLVWGTYTADVIRFPASKAYCEAPCPAKEGHETTHTGYNGYDEVAGAAGELLEYAYSTEYELDADLSEPLLDVKPASSL